MKEKLVVHTCCGVCMSYPRTILEDYDSIFYFYNPNIYPIEEYKRRRDEFVNYADSLGIKTYVEEEYNDVSNWYDDIKGFENEPEKGARCSICFKHRIKRAFEYAKNINAKYVTTVMTVSPHKNSKVIEMIGNSLADEYKEIKYLHFDFKKKDGFKKTNIIANNAGLYRQNYCGCEFSIRS
ncbi:epoxyqueuosine reductase QueH [Brachyspira innocens]|uniref:epoxyqueuosine reductase QueH n=1 Tax=Brachyspira innocens TaxID=13264 RepID=UPI00039BDAB2|nr:epoxyqueuosine reductase QueH [Brachyspira innocens]